MHVYASSVERQTRYIMSPTSFCTIATVDCLHELVGCICSIRRCFPGSPIYIGCDRATKDILSKKLDVHLNYVKFFLIMDKFANLGRVQLENKGLFLPMLAQKMTIIEIALQHCSDSLYVDSDVFFLRAFTLCLISDAVMSPAFVSDQLCLETGMFNAGYLWTRSIEFVRTWRKLLPVSTYYDQKVLDCLLQRFSVSIFSSAHNVMPWRLLTPVLSDTGFIASLGYSADRIAQIDNNDIVSLHTHLERKDFAFFNKLMISMMMNSNDGAGLAEVNAIISNRI